MHNHLLDLCASDCEILSGVERLGLLVEHAADACGNGETDVGVDVDLTYCRLCCLTELLLGNTNCIGKVAAECVDLCNVLLGNAGCAVKNDGELGEALSDLLKNVETERRGNENALLVTGALLSGELVSSVGGTDRDSERVNACTGYELLNLLGTCVRGMSAHWHNLSTKAQSKSCCSSQSAIQLLQIGKEPSW